MDDATVAKAARAYVLARYRYYRGNHFQPSFDSIYLAERDLFRGVSGKDSLIEAARAMGAEMAPMDATPRPESVKKTVARVRLNDTSVKSRGKPRERLIGF